MNGPVLALLVAPMLAIGTLVSEGMLTPSDKWLVVPGFLLGLLSAWCWWSWSVPRWRVWAWERVEDKGDLTRAAVEAGLVWPDGHLFSRTEFKSEGLKKRERELGIKCGENTGAISE